MPKPPRINVQLVHIQGPLKGEIQEFSESLIVIGREPECGVRFPGDMVSVSRRHAHIVREGNRFKLVDESTNGTFLNGKEIGEAFLTPGDVITLSEESGPKFSFLTEISEEAPDFSPHLPEDGFPSEPKGEGRRTPYPPLSEPAEPEPIPTSTESAPEPEPFMPPDPPPSEPAVEPELEPAAPTPPGPMPPGDREIERVKKPLSVQFGPTLRVFKELPIVVGRRPGCDWEIPSEAILDRQARIFFHDGKYWIQDLTGKALVRVNGGEAGPGVPLSPDDRIDLAPGGPSFQFMAGGRLLEVEAPPFSLGLSASRASGDEAEHAKEETGGGKKGGSFLGKWIKR